jgi:CRP-like cAMP-binding protein
MTHRAAHDPSVLDGVPFFEDVDTEERRRILELSTPREVVAGDLLVDQGDTAVECFLVLEGRLAVYVRGEYVASVGAGSMVGEMALVDHRPRTASVVAETAARLLAFRTKEFRQLLDEMPRASERILAELQARLDRNRDA